MSLTAIKNKVTSKVGRQILITQKHSPTLLFGVGVVGVATTVVLACRATLKMDEVLREAEDVKKQIEETEKLESEDYTKDDSAQDHKTNRVRTAFKIAKLYAPATAAGLITVGAFTGSHVILNRRYVALTAAYGALDKGFKQYRKNVVDEFGKEKDLEFLFEAETETDDEGNVAKKLKKPSNGYSIYHKFFDEGNRNWQPQWNYNQMFLRSQQNFANDILTAKGHIFLNEVYKMLGFEPTPAGQIVGWVKGNGDSFVDFGLVDTYEALRFVEGDEKSVILDFNVDGPVWDLI